MSALAVTVVALAVTPALAAGGGPVKGAKYTGSSGPGYPLSFKVSADGKAVDNLVVAYLSTCQPGAGDTAPKFHFGTLAIKDRKFSGTSTDNFFGKTESDKVHISGTFSGRDATGNLSDLAHIKSLPNCTDHSPFTAKAK
ncbi:MAG TPA: hypothetical protein VG186_17115 [Solirubrobacteraceae bacterium]|nr:hypothetical protein [Solirubrobacteraceae bacterium]